MQREFSALLFYGTGTKARTLEFHDTRLTATVSVQFRRRGRKPKTKPNAELSGNFISCGFMEILLRSKTIKPRLIKLSSARSARCLSDWLGF